MKKTIATLVCAILVLALLPSGASAAEAEAAVHGGCEDDPTMNNNVPGAPFAPAGGNDDVRVVVSTDPGVTVDAPNVVGTAYAVVALSQGPAEGNPPFQNCDEGGAAGDCDDHVAATARVDNTEAEAGYDGGPIAYVGSSSGSPCANDFTGGSASGCVGVPSPSTVCEGEIVGPVSAP